MSSDTASNAGLPDHPANQPYTHHLPSPITREDAETLFPQSTSSPHCLSCQAQIPGHVHPTEQTAEAQDAAWHARFDAGMQEGEIWTTWPPETILQRVLDTYPSENWADDDVLKLFGTFYEDAAVWMRIKTVGKSIGVNVFDLERAVKAQAQAYRTLREREFPALAQLDAYARRQAPAPLVTRQVHAHVITMQEVDALPVPWLWYPYIPSHMLTMLDGDPGIGKSMLTLQLAAILSQGWPLPGQTGVPMLPPSAPADTLFIVGEDSLAHTMRPRLDACGADSTKVHVLQDWYGEEEEVHLFTLNDMDVLKDALDGYRPRLVIIDPIQAYIGSKVDLYRENEVRPLLLALAKIAEEFACAIVAVRHLAKASSVNGGKVMMRGTGSIAFGATARSGLVVEEYPGNPSQFLLAQYKCSVHEAGRLGRTLVCEKREGHIEWKGVSRLTAEIVGGNARGPDPQALLEAYCWLERRLEGGLLWPANDIETAMVDEGYKKDTIRRAKKLLGVLSRKMSTEGWGWLLPPLEIYPYPSIYNPPTSVSLSTSVTIQSSVSSVSSVSIVDTPHSGELSVAADEHAEMLEDTEVTVIPPASARILEPRVASSVPEIPVPPSETAAIRGDSSCLCDPDYRDALKGYWQCWICAHQWSVTGA